MTLQIGTNWAGNLAYTAERIIAPAKVHEVRDALSGVRRARAVGSRHSFNDIADTSGLLISTERLTESPVVDAERRTVRAGAGTRYGDLGAHLQREGWALSNLASLPHISVAGAIATGTHGSGDRIGSLASAVAALEFVTAAGETVTLRRGDADFEGAVVSLGALGIVTHVTLDIEPTFQIAQHVFEELPLQTLIESFDAVTASGYSVSSFTTWRTPETIDQVWVKHRKDAAVPTPTALFDARPATVDHHPLPGQTAESCTPQLGVAGAWVDRLPHFVLGFTPSNGDELQTEYLVPRDRIGDALRVVRDQAGAVAPLLQVNEIRTVAGDELWLSPSHSTDVVGLHFTWLSRQPEVERVLVDLEEGLLPLGARPHWGKLFAADREALRRAYPRLDDFTALAERYDPEHVFRNAYLDRILG